MPLKLRFNIVPEFSYMRLISSSMLERNFLSSCYDNHFKLIARCLKHLTPIWLSGDQYNSSYAVIILQKNFFILGYSYTLSVLEIPNK